MYVIIECALGRRVKKRNNKLNNSIRVRQEWCETRELMTSRLAVRELNMLSWPSRAAVDDDYATARQCVREFSASAR